MALTQNLYSFRDFGENKVSRWLMDRRTGAAIAAQCLAVGVLSGAVAPVPPSIAAALAGPDRPWYELQQDDYRKPGALLAFARLGPGQVVANLVPGFGYYSRLLSKIAGPRGAVFAMPTAVYSPTNPDFSVTHLRHVALDLQDSGLYDNVVTIQQTYDEVIATPRQLDVIVCADCYNNLRNPWPDGTVIRRPGAAPMPAQPWDMAKVNANMFEALKPGGLYVVSDFIGEPGTGFTQTAALHRADKEAVKAEITAAGFVFDAESDALLEPADDDVGTVAAPGGRGSRYLLRFVKPLTAPRDKRPPAAANPMKPLYGNTRITGTLGGRTGIVMAFDERGRYYEYGGNPTPGNPGHAYQFGTLIFNARGQACYQDTYPVTSRGTISCHEKFVAKPGVVYMQGPTRAEDPTVYNLIPVVNGMVEGRPITNDDMLTAIAPGLIYPSQVTATLRKLIGR